MPKLKCRHCKERHEPFNSLDNWCKKIDCQTAKAMFLLNQKKKADEKKWRKEKKILKEKIKTRSDYMNELQVVFNKYIRQRDKGNNCISCGKKCKKENAGHYRSVGGNPELRFNELNCHLQCEYCNTYLHGNYINYRINLIKKIGLKKVEWLEGKHEPKKYTIEEIKELKEYYKQKIKHLNKHEKETNKKT